MPRSTIQKKAAKKAPRKKAAKKPAKKRSPKRSPGRPRSVMTDEVIGKILDTVRLGVWPDRAAVIHGVNSATMRMHKQRNPEFVTELEKAEAQAECALHSRMLRHMDAQWTAVAWMMERRWPERYAKAEVRAQLSISNVSSDDIVHGIHAFLANVEARHNPPGERDLDESTEGIEAAE